MIGTCFWSVRHVLRLVMSVMFTVYDNEILYYTQWQMEFGVGNDSF
jgi:hypothetical protein